MTEISERYKRLKARRTALKGSATRKLKRLSDFAKHEIPNKTAFEQSSVSLQQTLDDLRSVLKSMSDICLDLPDDSFDEAENDLEQNEKALETAEAQFAEIKCEFDSILFKYEKTISNAKTAVITSPALEAKAKFKPRDLVVPNWDGNLVTLNAWKQRLNDYFKLTGLTTESEQLAIFLYQNVLPSHLQSNLQDCTSVNGKNGIWERLDAKFPMDSIPRAILHELKESKPMTSSSAREMRRVLEQIKDFARHSKLVNRELELQSQSTLDIVEQKLTNNLMRNFRRWALKEHKDKETTVDLLITFLQTETELEERLTTKPQLKSVKPQASAINQVRSDSHDLCALCNGRRHRFVDCTVFRNYTTQQRTDAMRKLGRCFTCLAPMHPSPRDCRYRRRCATCGRSHHTTLACVSNQLPFQQNRSNLNASAAEIDIPNQNVRTANQYESNVRYSPSMIVELLDINGKWHKAVALLDSGSDVTLIKRSTAKMLNLDRSPYQFKFGTAGGNYCCENTSITSVWIRRCDQPSTRCNLTAIELEKPAHNVPKLDSEIFKQHTYLQQTENYLPTADSEIDILIGFDNAYLMKPCRFLEHREEPDNYPTGVETPLGWYIFGPKSNYNNQMHEIRRVHRVYVEDTVQQFRTLYESDVCGVKTTRICACSDKEVAESQFLKHVRNTIRQTKSGRIEVSLPWKEGFPNCLAYNRDWAFSKLKSLENRLHKSNLLDCYNQEMSLILNEFAEPVPDCDVINHKGWYINHFPVVRPGKSTSCRIVWNSAAIYEGLSLNDGLFKGPDLLNNLFCVLLAWRQKSIAITGDIRKMFNQIQLAPEDRLYHRFLWRNGKISEQPRDFQWKRLLFGDRSAPDLSISALRFLADNNSKPFPQASIVIADHCYMDDIATSFPSIDLALLEKKNINTILESGKFTVKGWHSNSSVVDEFPETTETEILGHYWNKSLDNFRPNFKIETPTLITKRSILSTVSKIWDPIGIFSPVILQLRLLLQSLWQLHVSWDDELPNSICKTFLEALKEIEELREYRLARALVPPSITNADTLELHGFCDGGESAYGAVIWLRYQTEQTFRLTFLTSKTYVAPIKKRSVPRLELMAAVILIRLVAVVKTVVKVAKITLWSDSATVLHWLHTPVSNFKPFVSTRIQEILEVLPKASKCFRYIKSSLNPADVLTKPNKKFNLSLWHQGPCFLQYSDINWPCESPPKVNSSKTAVNELKKNLLLNVLNVDEIENFEDVLLKRNSSWTKLVRIVAWLKRPILDKHLKHSTLTNIELHRAKLCLFWLAQAELRRPEQRCAREKLNLEISEEDKLLRIYGRLDNFINCNTLSNPIALPAKSQVTKLYAEYMHQSLAHSGYRVVIANLRQRNVFIIRGKQLLKSIAAKCVKCRIERRSLMQQQMGQLPSFRLKYQSPPFSSVSLDFFGPIKIKKTRNIVVCACVLIIACNTTRVIHLEIAETQSTNDFLLAWRRFVTKRGIHPTHVYSDQGKTFIGAQAPLKKWLKSWDKHLISEHFVAEGTKFDFSWDFNTPKASHMNGSIESLIRSCRKAFNATTNYLQRSYTFPQWETIIAESNYLVNSRPLFPNSVEDLDEQPVTGNSLLFPFGRSSIPQLSDNETTNPRLYVKAAQTFVNQFWKTWLHNIPPQILFRSKWFRPRQNLKVGDYVIVLQPGIKNCYAPRGLWEHAIVVKTFPGDDGLVRKVELKLSGQRSLIRPIHKLCLIATAEELNCTE